MSESFTSSTIPRAKLPYLQFYTGDYFRDPGVRSVSLAARGLWMDMLCLMHQSSRVGFLQHPSGLPIAPLQLARMVGHGLDEVCGLLRELEDSGVFSRTPEGVIYCRRMERDEHKRALCSEAGRRGGGNPSLLKAPIKVTFIGGDKGHPKGGVIPQSQSQSQSSESKEEADASLKTNRARGVREDVVAYIVNRGLPQTDGEWFFDKMLASGWKNGGEPVKDWQATVRTWQTCGFFPSQKQSLAHRSNGKSLPHSRPPEQRTFSETDL